MSFKEDLEQFRWKYLISTNVEIYTNVIKSEKKTRWTDKRFRTPDICAYYGYYQYPVTSFMTHISRYVLLPYWQWLCPTVFTVSFLLYCTLRKILRIAQLKTLILNSVLDAENILRRKIVHFTHQVCHLLAVTGTALSCCHSVCCRIDPE